ncbi:MAG: PspA/IM30 family protein [Oscillatoriaceae bacterium SKW80]|nr:PspA/IM30 family protein [Oscillatoriaceae bacterium SKYG93]MCX8119659.1 PspA/IM30 family protein [Oscillatoriaceae bacterium SKW80]MDW8455126.1 PspA/IM30 family protein [Oscillatoriaceae cyanobacterium SKYGB_i_bin93]HIK28100.1 PspA/IM30 family protein [Oscillatoriaceae cyanobacterium M7585_C2015_266]
MGLFNRIMQVIRANINSLVGKAEDPEKILEQAVNDMQEDLIQLRQAVAAAIATQKRTERQYSQTQSQAEEWYRRAQLALQKGDENLAREALTRRKTYQEMAADMKAQLEQQSTVVNQLKQNMRQLESKIAEAKAKKDFYIARARSAKASEKLNEMIGKLNTSSAINAFERMEEKVLQLEARSAALAELNTQTLENKFAALEGSSNVDAELAAMKAQPWPDSPKPQLPASQSSPNEDSIIIERELQQLRSEMENR